MLADDPSTDDRRRGRVYAIAAVLVVFGLILTGRLVYVQVVEHQRFQSMAAAEHWRQIAVPPRRGDIVDTNGVPLATSVDFDTLYASTTEIADAAGIATRLAPLLAISEQSLEARLARRQVAPTLLKAGLSSQEASEVRSLRLGGLFLQSEPMRAYPQGDLAAQVLGAVGIDDNGLSGIELELNAELAGTPGSVIAERDTGGDAIAFGPTFSQPPVDGARVNLTIDRYVQWVAERELATAIDRQNAAGGTVVVLDPRTGAILALASRPSFRPGNPELYNPADVALYGIPAIATAFEPGSLFKVVTLAAGLDGGAATAQTTFYNQGYLTYAGGTIHDAIQLPPGQMSMTQALSYSSNVGAAWVATRLGARRFYATVRAFGIGTATGVELPGETAGFLRLATANEWSDFDLATNSFGQGLAVTPLQVAAAMASIANGGVRMKPYVVQGVTAPTGARTVNATSLGSAIRSETATTLTRMLVSAVDDVAAGEEKLARVPGFAVAGLAGNTLIPPGPGYDSSDTVASFLGFAPAERPRFVILVRVDQPKDAALRDKAAAPVFGAIARQLLSYYQIPPSRPVPTGGT